MRRGASSEEPGPITTCDMHSPSCNAIKDGWDGNTSRASVKNIAPFQCPKALLRACLSFASIIENYILFAASATQWELFVGYNSVNPCKRGFSGHTPDLTFAMDGINWRMWSGWKLWFSNSWISSLLLHALWCIWDPATIFQAESTKPFSGLMWQARIPGDKFSSVQFFSCIVDETSTLCIHEFCSVEEALFSFISSSTGRSLGPRTHVRTLHL